MVNLSLTWREVLLISLHIRGEFKHTIFCEIKSAIILEVGRSRRRNILVLYIFCGAILFNSLEGKGKDSHRILIMLKSAKKYLPPSPKDITTPPSFSNKIFPNFHQLGHIFTMRWAETSGYKGTEDQV